MKLRLSSTICLFAFAPLAFASQPPMESVTVTTPNKFYVGVFGGGGSSNHLDGTQLGTAFFLEEQGGALAVNAFGELENKSAAFWGIQIGYQAQEIMLNCSQWALAPAVELEGYIMNRRSFNGDLINDTVRLPEHDFLVSYPTRRTAFLANAVLNVNTPCLAIHPYVGFGIGNAIVRISDADSTQLSPPEAGVNHYNANTSDTNSTFAGQIKLGLGYDITKCITLFAEYRWLYLANTHFVFGSTVYPDHAVTSNWIVKLDAQRYNLGSVGIRYNW